MARSIPLKCNTAFSTCVSDKTGGESVRNSTLRFEAEKTAWDRQTYAKLLGDTAKKSLPRTRFLGRFKINFVKVYDKRLILKASSNDGGDNPELFLDLESPRPGFTQQNESELHLGISANFRLEPRRDSAVKPHIDLYLPAYEIPRLIRVLTKIGGK